MKGAWVDAGVLLRVFLYQNIVDDGGESYDDETVLLVGADDNDKAAAEITLTPDMKPTEYTVDLGHCDRLIFFLRCNEDEAGSCPYGIYNITLNK